MKENSVLNKTPLTAVIVQSNANNPRTSHRSPRAHNRRVSAPNRNRRARHRPFVNYLYN